MREIVCRNNGRFSLEGNGEEVSAKVILNLKSTVDGVIVENMQNYDILASHSTEWVYIGRPLR